MADEAQWFRVFVEASLGVCAELRLPADQVSAESLERTCGHVQAMTSDIGQMFALVHGGERPGRAAGQLMPPRSELTLASATAQLSAVQSIAGQSIAGQSIAGQSIAAVQVVPSRRKPTFS